MGRHTALAPYHVKSRTVKCDLPRMGVEVSLFVTAAPLEVLLDRFGSPVGVIECPLLPCTDRHEGFRATVGVQESSGDVGYPIVHRVECADRDQVLVATDDGALNGVLQHLVRSDHDRDCLIEIPGFGSLLLELQKA